MEIHRRLFKASQAPKRSTRPTVQEQHFTPRAPATAKAGPHLPDLAFSKRPRQAHRRTLPLSPTAVHGETLPRLTPQAMGHTTAHNPYPWTSVEETSSMKPKAVLQVGCSRPESIRPSPPPHAEAPAARCTVRGSQVVLLRRSALGQDTPAREPPGSGVLKLRETDSLKLCRAGGGLGQ